MEDQHLVPLQWQESDVVLHGCGATHGVALVGCLGLLAASDGPGTEDLEGLDCRTDQVQQKPWHYLLASST